jgi:acid phosphatase
MLTSIALIVALIGAGVDVAVAVSSGTYPSRAPESTIEPTLTQILATQATQAALSPVSNVQGIGFNRIVQIWLENTVSAGKQSVIAG